MNKKYYVEKNVPNIVAPYKHNCEHLLGTFLDHTHYDTLVTESCNFYQPSFCRSVNEEKTCPHNPKLECSTCSKGIDEDNIVFVFRKNFFTQEEMDGALEGLSGAANLSQNRGLAAGTKAVGGKRDWVTDEQYDILSYFSNEEEYEEVLNVDRIEEIRSKYRGKEIISSRGKIWNKTIGKDFVFDKWVEEVKHLHKKDQIEKVKEIYKHISGTTYANAVHSGIAGWYDRYIRIPYGRATSYTEHNFETFKKAYPFLQKLSWAFSELLPKRYAVQKSCIDRIDPRFHVPDTVFTTITVNKSFRTAAHLDAGDLHSGFSNLTVVSNGKKYSGGILVAPEFRAAVDVRPGDLLLINNHAIIHGNTPIVLEEEGADRYSVVSYFRYNMLELGSKEYEDARHDFVKERKENESHPLWRPFWNGVSEHMFESEEWYNYLKDKLGEETLLKYHPEINNGNKLSTNDNLLF